MFENMIKLELLNVNKLFVNWSDRDNTNSNGAIELFDSRISNAYHIQKLLFA